MTARRPRLSPRLRPAVDLLLEAFAIGKALDGLPEGCRPRDESEGAAVQAALVEALGIETAGWRIARPSSWASSAASDAPPFAGRILAPRCFPDGTTIPSGSYPLRGVEGTLAFVLRRDLRPRARPYARFEILAAVDEARPAIEIVQSRFSDWRSVGLPGLVADNAVAGALVYGEPAPDWRGVDLGATTVVMRAGRRIVGRGRVADASRDPVEALRWLANRPRCPEGLAAGEIVTTGTCTGIHFCAPGDRVGCDFGALGRVAFRFR